MHFAAETHVTRSIFDNTVFYETDVLGTHNIANSVLKHADKIKRFIHISTSEVYGTAVSETMNEEHPLNPMSPYASAKCGADRLVYSYYQTYKIPCVILRPFNQYGPRQHLEKAVPRFITSCLLGEEIRLHGDGQAGRDWTFVEDTCRGIDCLLHADDKDVVGEVFNLGNDKDTSIKDIALNICELMNADKNKIINISDRPGQVLRHTCCSNKLKDLFGWEPQVNLIEGLKKTIEWYEKNQSFWKNQIWLREIEVRTENNAIQLH